MALEPRRIIGGVDTHADVHVAAVLDAATGRKLGSESFPTSAAGYAALLGWLQRLPSGPELRALRQQRGVSLTLVAGALGTAPIRLSELERGLVHDTALARRCRDWLTTRVA